MQNNRPIGPPPPMQFKIPIGPGPRPYFFYDYGGVYSGGKWPNEFNYSGYNFEYPYSICYQNCICGTPYPCQGECPNNFKCSNK